MGFLKALFGGKEESAEEKAQKENERKFDILKYDGVRARKAGEIEYAVRCFREALTYGKDVETMSFLAEALVAGKKPEEAYKVLETQAELDPERIGTRLSMAHVDEILQNFERAAKVANVARVAKAATTTSTATNHQIPPHSPRTCPPPRGLSISLPSSIIDYPVKN